MKGFRFGSGALVSLVGLVVLVAATSVAQAADRPAGRLLARVQTVTHGGREFHVIDRSGSRLRVVRPARPPQATRIHRGGTLVEASALHEGDTVLLTGVGRGDWFEASRVEVLTDERIGGARAAERVLRFTGVAGGRELRAVSADGAEYRIVFPPRPQVISLRKAGVQVEFSALREGDRLVVHGQERDGVFHADRLEVLDESPQGSGATIRLHLRYRGSIAWRRLVGEAADGTPYCVALPGRAQALYFSRDGALVEQSALQRGDAMEVDGVLRGQVLESRRILLR